MKIYLNFFFFLLVTHLYSQSDTEVFLLDVDMVDDKIQLSNPRNISNNLGYDNQPYFYDESSVIFASTRAGQTDILKFNILEGSTSSWLTDTPTGSEYSPLRIPESNAISAIRLDMDGLQRLYEYNIDDGSATVLLKKAKIGYHLWYTSDMLVATVLVENRMDLIVSYLADIGQYKTTQKNVGRSLQKIPNTELVSFISKENSENWELKSLNPVTGATEKITDLGKTEDICWLPDGTLLAGKDNGLYKFHPKNDEEWSLLQNFSDKNINNITRLAVNENATRLAFVAEPSPENIVQKQVEAFNSRNLIDFSACYSEDVVVSNFPNEILYKSNETLKNNYERFYSKTPQVAVEVVKRMSIGNTVIDEELVTIGDKTHQQVAIYEVKNGLISSMTFIHQNGLYSVAEEIVQEQLDAYNSRDIDLFTDTYTEDVKLYQYPNKLTGEGQDALRKGYETFFERTPDLNCEIKNRISIGNKIIDEEYLTMNGNNFSALAIYEVENGKISKVTFIQ
ncbi:nuclear transport factor 2 family protein [Maribacter sp.]|nr:nuclear transport factor 2 family protein [Maribacter sp.]